MKEDPRKYHSNIPKEENKYFGDEADEYVKPADYTAAERADDIDEARKHSD